MRTIFLVSLVTCVGLAACGSPSTQSSVPKAPSTPTPIGDPRTLRLTDTFAALVRLARQLDEQGAPDSQSGCLVTRNDDDLILQGDLSLAIHPIPAPPEDLASGAVFANGVDVITPWGLLGTGKAQITFATMTTFPPPTGSPGSVVIVRNQNPSPELVIVGPAPPPSKAMVDLEPLPDGPVFLTAEADVSLAKFMHEFESLSRTAGDRLVLAVALPPGTKLPESTPPGRAPSCDTWTDATGNASLDAGQAKRALEPVLADAGGRCLTAGGIASLSGGRVELWIRVNKEGHVGGACVADSAVDDALVLQCLLAAVSQTVFPPPSPAGEVDLAVPVVLSAPVVPAQRAFCAK